ncbi:MAG: DUF983 domain-containing protein [Planctomycetota bacterium]|jgi:uncharacterized protein (DUF983 family)
MSLRGTIQAFLAKRCPRCRHGAIYQSAFVLHKQCPECGLVYEREPGYFVGSLYISYAFAIVILGLFTLIGHLIFPEIDLGWIVLGAIVAFLPFVPTATRYARVLWMYLDRTIWPSASGQS